MIDRLFRTACAFTLLAAPIFEPARAAEITIDLDPARPTQSWLAAGTTQLAPTVVSNGLVDIPPYQVGWFDYDFSISRPGWYRLVANMNPGSKVQFLIDPSADGLETKLTDSTSIVGGQVSTGWAWLSTGAHRLRVRNYFWTGFPKISGMHFEALPDRAAGGFRLLPPDRVVFRKGACAPLTIEAGGSADPYVVDAVFRQEARTSTVAKIKIPPSAVPAKFTLDVPCLEAGDMSIDLLVSEVPQYLRSRIRHEYSVFDTSPVAPRIRKGPLVADIDAAAVPPDFSSCETSIVTSPFGKYRESGIHGSTPFIRGIAGAEDEPCWFAYRVLGIKPGHPYIFELDYPDDKPRVFVAALRDAFTQIYPASVGIETGAIWPLSETMMRSSIPVWPESEDARAIIFNIHDNMAAAVGHIRIYEADIEQLKPASETGLNRDVLFWYEEGGNFRSLVGAGHTPRAVFRPVDRYLAMARAAGGTIVSPTAVVYSFALYPSRFNLAFADDDRDLVAAFLLGAEHYGLKIVPQLHPRADELLWPPRDEAGAEARLLLSRDGTRRLQGVDGSFLRPPYYNIMNDEVRRWYIDMIGELAEKYKSYPAFAGVDLRFMTWQNPTLNNFVSLDWGYDAATVARFFRETGITPPPSLDLAGDTPEAARTRYKELTGLRRERWIAWRCEKIRDLYRDIAIRIQAARSDLKLYTTLFSPDGAGAEESQNAYREAGLDPDLLRSINGLDLIDARFRYGAREADLAWRRRQLNVMMVPGVFKVLANHDSRPRELLSMEYVEITGKVAPASAVGLPRETKNTWVSAASQPPGRLALSRYAVAVGLGDPMMLGDGGNGMVFGDEEQHEFLEVFRSLPAVPFERMANVPDAIVLRRHDDMFYVVNMTSSRVFVRMRISGRGSVLLTNINKSVTVRNGEFQLDLLAYQIVPFRLNNGQTYLEAVVDVESPPAAEKIHLDK